MTTTRRRTSIQPLRAARRMGALALASATLAACSTYYDEYRFGPSPSAATVLAPRTDEPAARVLATVAGIRRPAEGRPAEVEVRLRVENLGAHDVRLVGDDLVLVTGALTELPVERIEEGPDAFVAPHSAATIAAYFPLPPDADPDDYDLRGIDVRWTLELDGRRVTGSAGFERRVVVWYHDPWYPWGRWGPWGPWDRWHGRRFHGRF